MPIQKSDFLVMYPYKVEFQVNVFAPGEYVPLVPREFKYSVEAEDTDEETLSEEEKEALLAPRGETQKVAAITAIYYDAAKNSDEPQWEELKDDDIHSIIANRE